ncbi:restriction endonuclease subunit S [Ferrimonas balearica]|uniref:restriction endonuclease subunit S n=1 Tax=Ferrimonas balearica TaxID=44012 RepID=UPI001C992AF3|nr:restriction endonuclease subunit S [Ferrimonas balearica]MBY5920949.1 restriction endonuclease subunit S [Ferrimonas balearica]MBY5996366.1 restriction endonuclease subunit S [Ferrimonas balearica]
MTEVKEQVQASQGRYQPYPRYKASKVEGLSEVPEHWQEPTRIKFESSLKGRLGWQGLKASEYRDEGPHVVSSAHFRNCVIEWERCPRVSMERYNLDSNIQLQEGDILLMKDGAAMGKMAFVDSLPGPSCLNSHLLLFRPLVADGAEPTYAPKFLFYFLLTELFQGFIKVNGTGATFLGISQQAIGNYSFYLPPYDEQRTIAAFLDYETARIDDLIAKQQRLIELLKEKRQAVISHVVTKGLNPDAPMKDSGVEWLGQVPEHWQISQPRYLCRFMGGGTPSKDKSSYWGGDIPWVSPKDMKREVIAESIDSITMDAVRESSTKLIPTGSVLIVVRGMILAHSVPVAITSKPVTINQDMKALVCGDNVDGEYLLMCLQGLKQPVLDLVDSSAHGTKCLRTDQFETLPTPLPPRAEQKEIVAKVKGITLSIDQTIAAANHSISLSNERRTALISAAVTGKIDLREWKRP